MLKSATILKTVQEICRQSDSSEKLPVRANGEKTLNVGSMETISEG